MLPESLQQQPHIILRFTEYLSEWTLAFYICSMHRDSKSVTTFQSLGFLLIVPSTDEFHWKLFHNFMRDGCLQHIHFAVKFR